MRQMLKRYSEPTKYDQAQHGTAIKIFSGNNEFEIYVQASLDDEHPRWELVGTYTIDKHSDEFVESEIKRILSPS